MVTWTVGGEVDVWARPSDRDKGLDAMVPANG